MSKIKKINHLATQTIVIGNHPDPETGSVTPPIYLTSTYQQTVPGKNKGFEYGRTHNPTRSRLEEVYAAIENTRYAVSVGSGLAAETILLHSLPLHSHILTSFDVYGGTYRLFTKVFSEIHQFSFTDLSDLNQVEEVLRSSKISVIWLETPSNPLLKIVDLKSLVKLAQKYKAKVIVDNTFATPCGHRPIDFGVDVVFHSVTKYLNGHSDLIAGSIMLNDTSWYEKLFFLQNAIGTTQSAMDSWLIMRGLKTLSLRMKKHEENALAIAKWLSSHSKIKSVIYPGLTSHPHHALAKKQMKNFGGMLSVRFKDEKQIFPFFRKLNIFHLAESLGGVESLIGYPVDMTHASIPEGIREKIGVTRNLVRLSVGIEHIDDLKQDLSDALK